MQHTVIEELRQFVLFIAAVCFFPAYRACARGWGSRFATDWPNLPALSNIPTTPVQTANIQTTSFLSSIRQSSSSTGPGFRGIAEPSPKKGKGVVADWLIPAIVWFLVIMMGAAIVGFLLGER